MKKNMILAALCILMSTTVSMAKNKGHQAPSPVAQHVSAQHMNTHQADVIDMHVIREMRLSPHKYQQVEALNRRASAIHSSCNYRYELREILGQKAYSEYLERVNDRLTAELTHRPVTQPQVYFGRR